MFNCFQTTGAQFNYMYRKWCNFSFEAIGSIVSNDYTIFPLCKYLTDSKISG